MRLWPRKNAPEAKSTDVMPEWLWEQFGAQGILAPLPVSMERAVGLPAVLSVIRLISHSVGMIPLEVLRAPDPARRELAAETWQWRLLHKRPGPAPTTPFNFKADLAAHFSGRGNAYVRKLKPLRPRPGGPRVLELMPLNAAAVRPALATSGAVVFEDASAGGKPVLRGTDEIIQIRSFSIGGSGVEGISPITAARLLVEAGLRRHQFEERHLANGIFPGMGVKFPESITKEQAERWIELIESQHKSSAKAGKLFFAGGGAELVPIPISLEDAQFAEAIKLTLEQAAAIYQVPFAIATAQRNSATDDDWRHLTTFALGPVLTALAEAFQADDDLFAPGVDDDLLVRANADVLLKLDALKKAQVHKEQIQSGERLVDELRSDDGLAPLPPLPEDWTKEPGKVPQLTPVGGAPNPEAETAPAGDAGA